MDSSITIMNLWLDDVRPAPPGWLWAKNVGDALLMLDKYKIGDMSLDHDLGEGQKTGYDLLKAMLELDLKPHGKIIVHSQNPVGKENMLAFIKRYF